MQSTWRDRAVVLKEDALAVRRRMQDVRVDALANAVAMRSFLSMIPLIVVGVAVLGYLAAGDAELPQRIIDNLQLGDGEMADIITTNIDSAQGSRKAASVIGLVSLLWTGAGLFAAIAEACDAVWQVPTRGVRDKAIGLVWALGALVLLAAVGLGVAIVQLVKLPGIGLLASIGTGFAAGGLLFLWTQKIFTNVRVPLRAFVPGALVGGIALAVFQVAGSYIVPALFASASQLYSSLAAVIALLTVFLLLARLLLLSVVVSVVRWERGHGTVMLQVEAPALPGVKGLSGVDGIRSGVRVALKKPLRLPSRTPKWLRRR